jgi:hypothetical protein
LTGHEEEIMYCPKCGRPANESQRFCKGCGTNLLTVSQALSGRDAAVEEQKEFKERLCRFREGVRKVFVGLGLTFFFFFFLRSRALAAIGLLVFFIGLGKMLASMVFASRRLNVEVRVPTEKPVWTDAGQTQREISAPTTLEPPYVTEQTTIPLERPQYGPPERRE